jgi:hypothetical protein
VTTLNQEPNKHLFSNLADLRQILPIQRSIQNFNASISTETNQRPKTICSLIANCLQSLRFSEQREISRKPSRANVLG